MTATLDIENLLKWSKPRECMTKRGPRIVRDALATEEFWYVWRANHDALKQAGISVARDFNDPSKWHVTHWQELPKEVIEQRQEAVELSKATSADIMIPKPEGLTDDLYPFQKAGVRYALNCFGREVGCLIGDEPGLGKTLQAIGCINSDESISRVLVICPMTVKANWERELRKWLVRPLTIGLANSEFFPRTDIVICHYQILHKFPTRLSFFWDLLVIDESHRLGNARTRQTKCVVGYQPSRKEQNSGLVPTSGIPAKRKLALSGTPFENKPAQLWPLIRYFAPNLFSSKSAYERRYCGASNDGWGYRADGATNLPELAEKLRGCLLIRRRKEEVLTELPPKIRIVVEMDTEGFEDIIRNEQRVFNEHEEELEQAQVEAELAKAADDDDTFKKAVEGLRSKGNLLFTEIARVRHETAVAKTPKMIEMLRDELEEVSKAVVFAHHTDCLRAAAKAFASECVMITGDTAQEERDALVQKFQKDPKCRLFFGSIRATGEGITLTAASTVIFFENDWTASKMAQCSDRCHRIGQKDNVTVKYYILPGTIDAKMIRTWIRKEEILEKAMDSEREPIEEVQLIPHATPLATRKEIKKEALAITEANRWAILMALKHLSARCDGALALDGQGFNRFDSAIGKSLASKSKLSPGQSVLAQKILRKYSKQLDERLLREAGVK